MVLVSHGYNYLWEETSINSLRRMLSIEEEIVPAGFELAP